MDKIGRNLHQNQNHPLGIIKSMVEDYCNQYAKTKNQPEFKIVDSLAPIVDTKSCFDDLRVAPDHVSRRPSDTYYLTKDMVLRTHTSAHQTEQLRAGQRAFLCSGDVYRRDEVDKSHYPVFHQMEGVRIFRSSDVPLKAHMSPSEASLVAKLFAEEDMKQLLSELARHLFGKNTEIRWRDDYFPFTEPSFELDVFFNGSWMEVLGCGVMHDEVMRCGGLHPLSCSDNISAIKQSGEFDVGWAFGIGLERLAMVLFDIPDIRLFWSNDPRFLSQFSAGKVTKFSPYSKHPHCYKDVSFWLPQALGNRQSPFHSNDVYELIREVAGDMVEEVQLFDQFLNKKTGRQSHAYRVNYRHMDRSLTNEEVDAIQVVVRKELVSKLGVELR